MSASPGPASRKNTTNSSPPVPDDQVRRPGTLHRRVAHDPEDVVAHAVPIAVVDRLELEDVEDEQERARLAAARDGGQAAVLIIGRPGDPPAR